MRARPRLVASGILALSLAACGGVEARLPDGDTGDDSQPDAAPTGSITVTTYNRCCTDPGGLTAGVDVFVIEPDGSLGARQTTSGSGTVTLENVPAGSSVTALYPEIDGSVDRVTVVAVEPGDNLVFGETNHYSTGVSGQMTVTVPEYPNAYYYQMLSPCGSGSVSAPSTTATMYMYSESGCDPTDFDIEVVVVDNISYQVAATAWLDNVTFVDGGAVAVSAWSAATTLQLRVNDAPSEVTSVGLYAESLFTTGSRYYTGYRAGVYGSPTSGTFAGSTGWVTGAPGVMGWLVMYRPGDVGDQDFFTRFSATATSWIAEPTPLPWLGEAYVSAASRELAFAKLGDEAYDAAVLTAYWYDSNLFFGGKGGTSNYWTLILPPSVTRFSWANAPASIAGFLPTDLDSVSGQLSLVDFSAAADYRALRTLDESTITCPDCAIRLGTVDGQAAIAYGRSGESLLPFGPLR